MTNSTEETILSSLFDSTRRGNIDWQSTASDNTFQCSFPAGAVHLSSYYNADEENQVSSFTLWNPEGQIVMYLTDGEFPIISKLYEAARSNAFKAADVIAGILDFLKDK